MNGGIDRTLAATLSETPHRRLNPLTGEWVLVSPHRMQRPWQGQVEVLQEEPTASHDPACYLCPGNMRASGTRNPLYTHTFAFENDFAALRTDTTAQDVSAHALLAAHTEPGMCRVICFSPRHDLSLPDMETSAIRRVVDLWTEEYQRLGNMAEIQHVQIFENKGAMMGCSNPHPHGQIWAQSTIPSAIAREASRLVDYYTREGRTLLSDYLDLEIERQERIVCANDGFVALVPFWAVWPFEILVISRRPVRDLTYLTTHERTALADIVKRVTVRYDNLFRTSFPYSAGIHQAPTDDRVHPEWHFHMHFYPPLLRSATVRKFFVGYELLAEAQRDLTPEAAAQRLLAQSEILYRAAPLP
jgi:UDPglucose--hexose-1-phosphate uridylyltransferase